MDDTPRVETVIQERSNACDKHQWIVAEQDPNSELVGLVCTKCASGILVAEENVSKHIDSVI